MIEVVPLTRHVGAEIRGLDLRQEIGPATAAQLYASWLNHLVLVFRDQTLTMEDQRRFTALFGEIQPPRSRPGQRDPDNPVMWIANATIDGQRGELPEGDMQFHADQCYYENPAKGAVLYAIEIPKEGGNTLFANAYLAYETLPAGIKRRIVGKRAIKVGVLSKTTAIIDDGLSPGELVVTDGQYRIQAGSSVELLANPAESPG